MNTFLTSNETKWRLARTIVEGVLAVLIGNLDQIVGYVILSPEARAIVIAFLVAIISPIMSELGKKVDNNEK